MARNAVYGLAMHRTKNCTYGSTTYSLIQYNDKMKEDGKIVHNIFSSFVLLSSYFNTEMNESHE